MTDHGVWMAKLAVGRVPARQGLKLGVRGVGRWLGLAVVSLVLALPASLAAPPEVEVVGVTVTGAGEATTVVVQYRFRDADVEPLAISLEASKNDGLAWNQVPVHTLAGDLIVAATATWQSGTVRWAAGKDWPHQYSTQMRVRVIANDDFRDTYLVIDLAEGASAASYPVTLMATLPEPIPDEFRTTKLALRRIRAGTFGFGSVITELGRQNNETQRPVALSHDYYMGVFEVTQKQYELVMGFWPSYFSADPSSQGIRLVRPVEMVSWADVRGGVWPDGNRAPAASSFMGRLRAKTGLLVDLPTEAQWEYACRAGTSSALNHDKNLTAVDQCPHMGQVGRYWFNGGQQGTAQSTLEHGTAKVGSYLPNAWGLYDMHGNVWEWCLDWYAVNAEGNTDPVGAASGSARSLRGGSWGYHAQNARSANRFNLTPTNRWNNCGFRVSSALPVPAE